MKSGEKLLTDLTILVKVIESRPGIFPEIEIESS